ncbi:MAG: hypothetical protein KDI71_15115 [Xanthomonadales bacterium]|nr:hypothetical protein [Xanthomonadales bacterium]
MLAHAGVVLALMLWPPNAAGQKRADSAGPSAGISHFLDARGHLQIPRDFTGSLNPAGYRMILDQDQSPRFVADSRLTPGQRKLFGVPSGCNSEITSVAVAPSGLIFLGGYFTACEDSLASRVVAYDRVAGRFIALGADAANGVNDAVFAIAIGSDGSVFVGGRFTQAGGMPAAQVARWDGQRWSALGSVGTQGTDGEVRALALIEADLYVGGRFASAGGIAARNIARWDGNAWSALGIGVGGPIDGVSAIAAYHGELHVAGFFDRAGGAPANNVARWDGSSWFALGSGSANGVSASALAMAVSGDELIVGGNFLSAGGEPASGIARWNGGRWTALGDGVNNVVLGIADGGNGAVYAVGQFTRAGGTTANRVARWSGTQWQSLTGPGGNGLDDPANSVVLLGDGVVVAGSFREAGGDLANRVAIWNGSGWEAPGTGAGLGLNGSVRALAISAGQLYVGGFFSRAGALAANNIARWNGSTWFTLGDGANNGVNGSVLELLVDGTDLYVGGGFTRAGGATANRIARWDGASWTPLGSGAANGVSGDVRTLAQFQGALHIGGSFEQAGGQVVNGIARWHNGQWFALSSGGEVGVGDALFPFVADLLPVASGLLVGGEFARAGATQANNLAHWDGQAWTTLGSGINNGVDRSVNSLAEWRGDWYAGGSFTHAGGTPANYVARWNGSNWSALVSQGFNGLSGDDFPFVYALDSTSTALYVGGSFQSAGAVTANGLARWDGSRWEGLGGSSIEQSIRAISIDGESIFAGGNSLTQTPLAELQTRAIDGGSSNGLGRTGRVNRGGDKVAFSALATNLTEDDADTLSDIFVRDVASGTIARISIGSPAAKGGSNEDFFDPAIAPLGDTVSYRGSSGQLYAHYRGLGRTASSNRIGEVGNGQSSSSMVPGAGDQVLFTTTSTNLLDGVDGNGSIADVVIKDLDTGMVSLISIGANGEAANGDSQDPWASDDAQTVAFSSLASNLSDDQLRAHHWPKGAVRQVLLSHSQGLGRSATYVSRNLQTGELGNADSTLVRLTPDGRYGVFQSLASNLVAGDSNGLSDIFYFEVEQRRVIRLERISVSRYGVEANGPSRNPVSPTMASWSVSRQTPAIWSSSTSTVEAISSCDQWKPAKFCACRAPSMVLSPMATAVTR